MQLCANASSIMAAALCNCRIHHRTLTQPAGVGAVEPVHVSDGACLLQEQMGHCAWGCAARGRGWYHFVVFWGGP